MAAILSDFFFANNDKDSSSLSRQVWLIFIHKITSSAKDSFVDTVTFWGKTVC
jgi:hypothetical protein